MNRYPTIPHSLRRIKAVNEASPEIGVGLACLYHHYYLDAYGRSPPNPLRHFRVLWSQRAGNRANIFAKYHSTGQQPQSLIGRFPATSFFSGQDLHHRACLTAKKGLRIFLQRRCEYEFASTMWCDPRKQRSFAAPRVSYGYGTALCAIYDHLRSTCSTFLTNRSSPALSVGLIPK